ncbi:MAG: RsmB/NOP family class I SAM-dependent RNA methyltransferase [Rhabdochlamydiaceae bacterium]
MNQKFLDYHLFTLLNHPLFNKKPLDVFLSEYFRRNKNIGSKERRFISETIYHLVRWQLFFDFFNADKSWESRYRTSISKSPLEYVQASHIPEYIRLSMPEHLFHMIVAEYGIKQARDISLICNQRAPLTIRANLLKTDRENLFQKWKKDYKVQKTPLSPLGIVFPERINFFGLPEFKQGLFEIQDEGSQLLSLLVKAEPKQHILDYCAGSGGKTLAFAPYMENKGIIYLHDIRNLALEESKKRLKRAGIQNAQQLYYEDSKKNKLVNTMDWVLVDAPCSGTGTLRRNPDMKWKISNQDIKNLVDTQRIIFADALSFCKKGSKIIYSTCSILSQENEEQALFFTKKHNLEVLEELKLLPTENGHDGFYAAVFVRK